MKSNYRNLNIMLTVCLAFFILPWVLIPYEIISVPESLSMPILGVALLFGFLYYVVLGILASKKNRSVITWVGLTVISSPFGHIISYPLMLSSEKLPKIGYID